MGEESNLESHLQCDAYQWLMAGYDAQDRLGHTRTAADLAVVEVRASQCG